MTGRDELLAEAGNILDEWRAKTGSAHERAVRATRMLPDFILHLDRSNPAQRATAVWLGHVAQRPSVTLLGWPAHMLTLREFLTGASVDEVMSAVGGVVVEWEQLDLEEFPDEKFRRTLLSVAPHFLDRLINTTHPQLPPSLVDAYLANPRPIPGERTRERQQRNDDYHETAADLLVTAWHHLGTVAAHELRSREMSGRS